MRPYRGLVVAIVTAWVHATLAQPPGVPTKADIDVLLANAAKGLNSQLANTRIDNHTTFKLATYDKPLPLFSYTYTTTYLASKKRASYSQAEREDLRQLHRDKTCSSQFAPLMRAYGLQVEHRFEDSRNGLQVLSMVFMSVDCTRGRRP